VHGTTIFLTHLFEERVARYERASMKGKNKYGVPVSVRVSFTLMGSIEKSFLCGQESMRHTLHEIRFTFFICNFAIYILKFYLFVLFYVHKSVIYLREETLNEIRFTRYDIRNRWELRV